MSEPKTPGKLQREENLARATENLTLRVEALLGAVTTNNSEVKRLRSEVNKKPDDSEILFLTGMARQQRKRHLHFTIYTSIICAVLAGAVAFAVADHQSSERCKDIQHQTDTISSVLGKFDPKKQFPIVQDGLKELRKERVNC